jgi:uncharacterized protein YceK
VKLILAAALLVPLVGCGSMYNLATGPRVYGGTRYDVWAFDHLCKGGVLIFDVPFSAVVDTGLLPLTALFELVRWMSGWPPLAKGH